MKIIRNLLLVLALAIMMLILVACGCEHEYVENITKQASCAKEGEITATCILCGDTKTSVIPKTDNHSYMDKITKQATCVEDGEKATTCSICGDTKTSVIPKTNNHSYTDKITKKATCADAGEKVSTCSVCGDTKTTVLAKTNQHLYTEKITKKVTCGEDGEKVSTCSVCGDTKTTVLAKTNQHSYTDKITKEATCAEAGEKTSTCSVCGYTKKTTISKTNNHSYTEKITVQATCTAQGSKTLTCKVCGKTKVESISSLGHKVDSTGKCSRCGRITLEMTSSEIERAKKTEEMSHSVSEYSSEIDINIKFKDANGYTLQFPAYVEIKIVDEEGNTLYSDLLIKKASQDRVTIDYEVVKKAKTNTGTLYYKVYNDYVSFREVSQYLEKIPWTVDVDLPYLPQIVYYYKSSSCKVTGITYEVSDDDITFYFTGEKTYDKEGINYSQSCKIGWKLYDSDGYVVADGTCFTTSLKVGEKFKNAEVNAWGVIEQGKTYRLAILDIA